MSRILCSQPHHPDRCNQKCGLPDDQPCLCLAARHRCKPCSLSWSKVCSTIAKTSTEICQLSGCRAARPSARACDPVAANRYAARPSWYNSCRIDPGPHGSAKVLRAMRLYIVRLLSGIFLGYNNSMACSAVLPRCWTGFGQLKSCAGILSATPAVVADNNQTMAVALGHGQKLTWPRHRQLQA